MIPSNQLPTTFHQPEHVVIITHGSCPLYGAVLTRSIPADPNPIRSFDNPHPDTRPTIIEEIHIFSSQSSREQYITTFHQAPGGKAINARLFELITPYGGPLWKT